MNDLGADPSNAGEDRMSTTDLVEWLRVHGGSAGLCRVLQVDFQPDVFLAALDRSGLAVVRSRDGAVSVVREQEDPRDASRRSTAFQLHTDGCYLAAPPRVVLLYCVDPGRGRTPTFLADTTMAIAGLEPEVREILDRVRFLFIDKNLERVGRPLLEAHPVSGRLITNLATRGVVEPVPNEDGTVAGMPELPDITEALTALYLQLRMCVTMRHTWREGDLLVFDNHTFVHGRQAAAPDPDRTLQRVWLDSNA